MMYLYFPDTPCIRMVIHIIRFSMLIFCFSVNVAVCDAVRFELFFHVALFLLQLEHCSIQMPIVAQHFAFQVKRI